jgi:hypothetical protein
MSGVVAPCDFGKADRCFGTTRKYDSMQERSSNPKYHSSSNEVCNKYPESPEILKNPFKELQHRETGNRTRTAILHNSYSVMYSRPTARFKWTVMDIKNAKCHVYRPFSYCPHFKTYMI